MYHQALLLFIIYYNYLLNLSHIDFIIPHADDTAILSVKETWEKAETKNELLYRLLAVNKLFLNALLVITKIEFLLM